MVDPKILEIYSKIVTDETSYIPIGQNTQQILLEVPQECYNKRVASGYNLDYCPEIKIKRVPQFCWDSFVANAGDVDQCPKENLDKVPDDCWIHYFEKSDIVSFDLVEKLKSLNVPQTLYNGRVVKGLGILNCPEENLKKVPQILYNRRMALSSLPRDMEDWPEEKAKNVPPEIATTTKKARRALDKCYSGKIAYEKLPVDVYVNGKAREELIDIITEKLKEKYNKFCDKKGYRYAPYEVECAYKQALQEICDYITRRMDEGIEELSKTDDELAADEFAKLGKNL